MSAADYSTTEDDASVVFINMASRQNFSFTQTSKGGESLTVDNFRYRIDKQQPNGKRYRGSKSCDLLIQLSMHVSENLRVWHPLLGLIGADGSVL
jgi:hypothetical protein